MFVLLNLTGVKALKRDLKGLVGIALLPLVRKQGAIGATLVKA